MSNKNNGDWFKHRSYAHFSPKPLPKFVRQYVTNPTTVAKHGFHPFIYKPIIVNTYRRRMNEEVVNGVKRFVRATQRTSKRKERKIMYADHLDAHIYSYYNKIIYNNLELAYKENKYLSNSVTAYRRIPTGVGNSNKNNIHFAKDVFDYIKENPRAEQVVLCFDIKKFFDTLCHHYLKRQWKAVLGVEKLPCSHYAVYKNITRYSFVDMKDILRIYHEHEIKNTKQRRFKNIDVFCASPQEFRERIVANGLIQPNKLSMGIPQGSPISATLANLYMLEFDKKFSKEALENGDLYRRYSDDLVYITTLDKKEAIKSSIIKFIKEELYLEISQSKLQEFVFTRNHSEPSGFTVQSYKEGVEIASTKLSYLGFYFDGKNTFIRNSSLSKYYRGVKRLIKHKAIYAKIAKSKQDNPYFLRTPPDPYIYRERIYKSKSHLSAKTKVIKDEHIGKGGIKIRNKKYWGNYVSYAYLAEDIMGGGTIRRQVRNHWKIIHNELQKYEAKYDLQKFPFKKRLKNPLVPK